MTRLLLGALLGILSFNLANGLSVNVAAPAATRWKIPALKLGRQEPRRGSSMSSARNQGQEEGQDLNKRTEKSTRALFKDAIGGLVEAAYIGVAAFVIVGFMPAITGILFVLSIGLSLTLAFLGVALTALENGALGVIKLLAVAGFASLSVQFFSAHRALIYFPSLALGAFGFWLFFQGSLAFLRDLAIYGTISGSSTLHTEGAYSRVRHPMYGGLLLACLGVAGLTASAPRAAATVLLFPVLVQQSRIEDDALRERHGANFEEYSSEVPCSIIPFEVDAIALFDGLL